jgi:LytS/YehU family sensor histidine kinase
LRHLVELVAVNAMRAERILADLGDFLRGTLNGIHEPILTLRAEGETLRAYARVLSVASARGLTVQLSIPLALMDERVPSGVLRVALDSVLYEHSRDNTVVHLEVTSGERGISIQATAQSAGGTPNSWKTTVNGSELVHEAAVA